MTTTPSAGPGVPAGNPAALRLSRLLRRPVTGNRGESIGRLADVIVRLRGADYPHVTGLVVAVGGREIFVPIDQVSSWHGDPLRLASARLLVTLVQADPAACVFDVSDIDPIRVGADADITAVAVLMTDYNLITIPVVDDACRLLGVITVDDVLEVALPEGWRRRETAPPPDSRHGGAR